jgi:Flp pilus assembly protein TadG
MRKLSGTPNRPVVGARKWIPRRPGSCRSQSGQSVLELALLVPFLLVLLFGVIEMGRFAYIGILVGNAARAGAAYGAQNLPQSVDTAGIQAAADNDFQNNGQTVSNLTVASSVSCGCDTGGAVTVDYNTAAGCSDATSAGLPASISLCIPPSGGGHWVVMVSVTASGKFNSLFGFPGIPNPIAFSRTATMRVAQ